MKFSNKQKTLILKNKVSKNKKELPLRPALSWPLWSPILHSWDLHILPLLFYIVCFLLESDQSLTHGNSSV